MAVGWEYSRGNNRGLADFLGMFFWDVGEKMLVTEPRSRELERKRNLWPTNSCQPLMAYERPHHAKHGAPYSLHWFLIMAQPAIESIRNFSEKQLIVFISFCAFLCPCIISQRYGMWFPMSRHCAAV